MNKSALNEIEFEELKSLVRDLEQYDIADLLEGVDFLMNYEKSLGKVSATE